MIYYTILLIYAAIIARMPPLQGLLASSPSLPPSLQFRPFDQRYWAHSEAEEKGIRYDGELPIHKPLPNKPIDVGEQDFCSFLPKTKADLSRFGLEVHVYNWTVYDRFDFPTGSSDEPGPLVDLWLSEYGCDKVLELHPQYGENYLGVYSGSLSQSSLLKEKASLKFRLLNRLKVNCNEHPLEDCSVKQMIVREDEIPLKQFIENSGLDIAIPFGDSEFVPIRLWVRIRLNVSAPTT